MFAFFRRLSKSTIGTIILVAFLLAILASFALADISGSRVGSLGSNADTLVQVGDEPVTDRDLSGAMRRALNQVQAQNPEATYASLAGDFASIVNQLIDERAILAFASDHGFVLSKRLVDAEIANLPQTRGFDGKFSEQAYAAFLQQQQLTDVELRRLLQVALSQRLVLAPAAVEARVPLGVARPYASMLLEQRQGQLALIPVADFRNGLNPSDGDLQSFYAQNRQRYVVPEQRTLKIAKITPDTIPNAAPTEAEIAAYYRANQATYAGAEQRVISQAVVQDKAVADGIAARARGGATFAAAAAPAGLGAADVNIGAQTKAGFAQLANDAVANSVFAAAKGAIVGPVRSDLGWHVIRVDEIRAASGRSLDQARAEIAAKLAVDKRKAVLTDTVTKVEDAIDDGSSFAEVTAASKLPVVTTPAITGSGSARRDPAFKFPAELAPALKTGFALAAGDDPEVVTLPNNAGYALVSVDRIALAAAAPLAEVRDQVRGDWIQRKASDRARAVAAQVAAQVARGVDLAKAMATTGVKLPPVQPVDARRIQISQVDAATAAPLKMLFTLLPGKSRMIGDPQGRGFFIVKVDKVLPGNAMSNPALIAQTQSAFQQTAAEEIAAQFLAAMKTEQGVKRNEKAIAAAKQRITGSGS